MPTTLTPEQEKRKAEIDQVINLEDLQEKRNSAVKAVCEFRDKFHSRGDKDKNQPGRWEDDAEERAYDAANFDIDEIDRRMKTLRDSSAMEKRWAEINETNHRNDSAPKDINDPRPKITSETRMLAFQGFLNMEMDGELGRRQLNAISEIEAAGGKRCRKGQMEVPLFNTSAFANMQREARAVHPQMMQSHLHSVLPVERRAMNLATTTGGDFVPEGFVRELEISMLAFMAAFQAGSIIRTSGGGDLPWPTMNDTGNKGELLGINTGAALQDPTTGVVVFNAYKMSSKVILVPYELLEDEDLSGELPAILNAAIAERIGRISEQYATTGTGSSEPQGVVVGSAAGPTTATTTAILADELIDLEHSVDPAYRSGPSVGFMAHDSIIGYIRKLKTTDLQYIWQPGLQMGRPDSINGHQLWTNQEMEATASNAPVAAKKHVLFGDFSKFKIREVNNIRLYRLQERYREVDQDGFIAFKRFDSKVLDAGTDPIKHLLQAAV